MTHPNKIVLGLGVHRPEMIPILSEWMESCDVILLEEPPGEGFTRMLSGGISIDDYLMQQDLEYPVYSRRLCRLLQTLTAHGKTIYQVEPYLETLAGIHDLFAGGFRPADIVENSVQHRVYLAEHKATGALLDFYGMSLSGSFREILEAVKRFARKDAARFRLRDALRAQELAGWVATGSSVFIEAGLMHYPLRQLLRQHMATPERLQTVFLADTPLRKIGLPGRLFGPGDQLTLLYVFHPELTWPDRESHLAARALVYNKLIAKTEHEDSENIPHLREEQACIALVGKLSFDDCSRLYPLIRDAGHHKALEIVRSTQRMGI